MLSVEAIENGTVIDHIRAGRGKEVLDILGIGEDHEHLVALVMNVNSKRTGKKDMMKISGMYVKDELANKVALISPNATINIIKNSKVEHKHNVELPQQLKVIGRCPSPNCITNDKGVGDAKTLFKRNEEDNYQCNYCERLFPARELI